MLFVWSRNECSTSMEIAPHKHILKLCGFECYYFDTSAWIHWFWIARNFGYEGFYGTLLAKDESHHINSIYLSWMVEKSLIQCNPSISIYVGSIKFNPICVSIYVELTKFNPLCVGPIEINPSTWDTRSAGHTKFNESNSNYLACED